MIHALYMKRLEDRVRQNILGVAVHDSIHICIAFEYFGVDVALCIASHGAGQRRAVRDKVLADVGRSANGGGTLLQRDEEGGVVVRVSHAHVAHSVEDIVVMQDVVGCYEGGEGGGEINHRVIKSDGSRGDRIGKSASIAMQRRIFRIVVML
jgi:hypothetical protein